MTVRWIKGMAISLLAMTALSACQKQPKQYSYAQPAYAAGAPCGPNGYAPPSSCYPPPVQYAPPRPCQPIYREAKSSYRHAQAPSACAPTNYSRDYRSRDYRPRDYRYVGGRPAPTCRSSYRSSYQRSRPAYDRYRPQRYSYRSQRSSSCCY